MTFRIDGGKKPGHLRTTSEEKASEAQPVPRVSKVSRKHHTRTPSLSRQEKTGRSQSDLSERRAGQTTIMISPTMEEATAGKSRAISMATH